MKILITENQVERTVLVWMNMNYGPDQLEIVTSKKYPNYILYRKNGKFVMYQDNNKHYFYFDYDIIWSFFGDFFGLKHKEIEGILKSWLEDTLKLEGYTPDWDFIHDSSTLG